MEDEQEQIVDHDDDDEVDVVYENSGWEGNSGSSIPPPQTTTPPPPSAIGTGRPLPLSAPKLNIMLFRDDSHSNSPPNLLILPIFHFG